MAPAELHAESVEHLPDRVALVIAVPSVAMPSIGPATIAGFWSDASGAAGNAE